MSHLYSTKFEESHHRKGFISKIGLESRNKYNSVKSEILALPLFGKTSFLWQAIFGDFLTKFRKIQTERTILSSSSLSLFAVLVLYLVVFGVLLVRTGGFPYIIDNNESFSSLVHAFNLYHFDFKKAFGLTDESYSPFAVGHPYVYTHQGNFPRFFALIIYALGARSIEAQIIVTTFSIGLASIIFTHRYFCKVTNPLFAFLCCAFLMTDYLMYTQWQVVTFRVWYGFFFFSSLLCVQALKQSKRSYLLTGMIFLNYLCLSYFDLTFVVFVNLCMGIYTLYIYYNSNKTILKGWALQAAGSVVGFGILFAQLIAYMGLKNTLDDAKFTFLARSFTSYDNEINQRALDFYNKFHIAFWPAFRDYRKFVTVKGFLKAVFSFDLQIYTPFFVLITFVLGLGWFLGLPDWDRLCSRIKGSPFKLLPETEILIRRVLNLSLSVLIVYFLYCIGGLAFMGADSPMVDHFKLKFKVVCLAVGIFGLFGKKISTIILLFKDVSVKTLSQISVFRLILLGLFILFVACFSLNQNKFYDQGYFSVWEMMLWNLRYPVIFRLTLFVSMGFSALLILSGTKWVAGSDQKSVLLTGLTPFFISGILAFAGTFCLFPGYVHTVYLYRTSPMLVFTISPIFAVALYVIVQCLKLAFRSMFKENLNYFRKKLSMAFVALAVTLLLFDTIYWARLQLKYMMLFPANHYEILKKLKDYPYQGASFVSTQYAAPIAMQTGNWAYIDDKAHSRNATLTADGYIPDQDLKTYIWFADREANPAYKRPEYFIALTYQPYSALPEMLDFKKSKKEFLSYGASQVPSVKKVITVPASCLEEIAPTKDTRTDLKSSVEFQFSPGWPDYSVPYIDRSPSLIGFEVPQPILEKSIERTTFNLNEREFRVGPGCFNLLPITQTYPQDKLMERDRTQEDRWAILKLDWEFPPLLKPLSTNAFDSNERGSGSIFPFSFLTSLASEYSIEALREVLPISKKRYISLETKGSGSKRKLKFKYNYYQQDGHSEGRSQFRLYRYTKEGLSLILEKQGLGELDLPVKLKGQFVASIVPISEEKVSEVEYFSEPIDL